MAKLWCLLATENYIFAGLVSQTNQSRKNHPLPNIGAYKIPHLQSQFPPNPTPT